MTRTHPSRPLPLPLCALLLSLGLSLPCAAAPPPPSAPNADDAAQSARAKDLYTEGVKAASRGKWEQARALLLEAYRLRRHFQIAINLGQAELKIGLYRDAAEHLSAYLNEAQNVSPDERKQAADMLAAARAHVGTLHVRAEQAGAEVRVDGALIGKAPLEVTLFVEPGKRSVEATLEGYKPTKEAPEIAAGAEVTVALRLEAAVTPVAPVSPPDPAMESPVPTTGGPRKAIVIGGIAAAGVGVAIGAGLAIGSNVKAACRTKAEMTHSQATYDDCETARVALANASFYSFIAAGAIGAGTAIYALVSRRSPGAQNAIPAMVFVGPKMGGVVVTARW